MSSSTENEDLMTAFHSIDKNKDGKIDYKGPVDQVVFFTIFVQSAIDRVSPCHPPAKKRRSGNSKGRFARSFEGGKLAKRRRTTQHCRREEAKRDIQWLPKLIVQHAAFSSCCYHCAHCWLLFIGSKFQLSVHYRSLIQRMKKSRLTGVTSENCSHSLVLLSQISAFTH